MPRKSKVQPIIIPDIGGVILKLAPKTKFPSKYHLLWKGKQYFVSGIALKPCSIDPLDDGFHIHSEITGYDPTTGIVTISGAKLNEDEIKAVQEKLVVAEGSCK